jgi:hypothetical protein
MGRGQVLRNQRLGRPGQRGSGGGRRGVEEGRGGSVGGRRGVEEGRGRGRGRGQQRNDSNLSLKHLPQQEQQSQPYKATTTTAYAGIMSSLDPSTVDNDFHVTSTTTTTTTTTANRIDDDDELMLGVFETQGNYYGNAIEKTDLQDTNFWKSNDPSVSWNMKLIDQALSIVSLADILGLPPYLTESMENQTKHLIGATLRGKNLESIDSESLPETKIAKTQYTEMEGGLDSNDDEEDLESWLDSVIS